MKICLDFGHGGKDSGAVGNGLKEKDVVLAIGKKLEKRLKDGGYQVVTTRKDDTFIELTERSNISNKSKSDLFISLHCNSFSDVTANGYESYTNNATKQTKYIHDELAKLFSKDRGIKKADFSVLRKTTAPSMLLELGFISNKKDVAVMKKYDDIVKAIYTGVQKMNGVKDDTIYRVCVGSFHNYDNANRLKDELDKKGYKGFIIKK